MSIDDLAGPAAAELCEASAASFDVDAGLAAIGPASRRRTRSQQAAALVAVSALVLVGWLAVRPESDAAPQPAITPSPSPSATIAPVPLVVQNAVVRPDPVNHRSFVILTVRNTMDRPIDHLPGYSFGPNHSDPPTALDAQFAFELYAPAAGRKAMLASLAEIAGTWASGTSDPIVRVGPSETLTGLVRVTPDCAGGTPFPEGEVGVVLGELPGPEQIFEPLIQVPGNVPAWLSSAVAAACSAPAPGSDIVDTLAPAVIVEGKGTQTVELGAQPPDAARVEIRLACLSTGTFYFDDNTGLDCTESTVGYNSLPQEPVTILTLTPGQHTTRIKATPGARWRLSTTYDRVRRVPWGVNQRGQTYGVANSDGTPDLVQVVADNGQIGYAEAARMVRPTTPTSAPDPDQTTVPVYASDGQTVLGQFLNY